MASTGEPFGLFWNSDNKDRTYDANSLEYWLKKFFTSGVFNGDLQVQATSGMTIKVGAGYANVDGKVKFWNAEFNLTLDPANSTYPRIDTVVITRDNVNREIRCEVVTGGYSGDTPQPTAPVRNAEIYQLVLAQIYVANGATGITQAEITDTRPNTNLCGWITGTVTELDFEQFTVQFESYFAQFKRQHENEWSVWELTQKAAYAAWLSEVKAQQVQDKANWDAWYAALQEELHELPSDTAEYLQIEIDEIKESGTTGSILHITTTNSELEGKTVTVSCGTETRSGTFDSNLECTIVGFKSVGTLTITSTDGIRTATRTIIIDYYSKYEIAIAFWSATVNIQGDDNLKGVDVVVKDSDDTTITTITLNVVTGQGVFDAQKADTYTFNYTVNGTTYSIPLAVTEETTYELSLAAGFDYKQWVTLGGLDPTDYTDLEDVFADEVAVRRLMTIHASSDYLIEKVTDDIDTIDEFVANDTAMKWIGLRDYVCDGLTAISGVEAKFLASEYWERYLKDHVPVMTSNTVPYGTASANSNAGNNYYPYKAFDNSDSSLWANSTTSASHSNTYVGYAFTNPVCIRRVYVHFQEEFVRNVSYKIQGSNDNSNWADVSSSITTLNGYIDLDNDDYYLYYRLYIISQTLSSSVAGGRIYTLQFYGRSLDVSVPVMTSNTAPYGEAFASSNDPNTSYSATWKAFADTGNWATGSGQKSANIGYVFISPVYIKKAFIKWRYDGSASNSVTYKLQGSNDGSTWVDISDSITKALTNNLISILDGIEPDVSYKYIRLEFTTTVAIDVSGSYVGGIYNLQFYGVDYTEREFAEGSTMKYLYDHGVELETINTTGTVTKDDDHITLSAANAQASHTLDLTPYDLLRGKVGDHMSGTTALIAGTTATANMTAANAPNNESLNVSSVNASLATGAKMTAAGICDITELWLE